MARRMVNPDCDHPAPDVDMGEEEWDYAYPGCERDEDWKGAMAPQLTPPNAANPQPPQARPFRNVVSGTQSPKYVVFNPM